MEFCRLKNYRTVFTDHDLIQPLLNTALFTVVTMISINVIGLTLAMTVNQEFRGINVIKSIIFVPLVVSLVLVSQMWMYVYSDFFRLFGWKSPLIDKKLVMLGLSAMSIWRESGLAMIIYLAALKRRPAGHQRGGHHGRSRVLAEIPQCHRSVYRTGVYLLYSALDGIRAASV